LEPTENSEGAGSPPRSRARFHPAEAEPVSLGEREPVWLRYWPVVAVVLGMYVWTSAWLAILLYHAGILVAACRHPSAGHGLGRGGTAAGMAFALGAGLLVGPVTWFALPVVLGPGVGEALALQLERFGLNGWSLAVFCVVFTTVHPLLEELAWRGMLGGDGAGFQRVDLEFAAYHQFVLHRLFPGEWVLLVLAMAGLTGIAWIWRRLAVRSDGLRLVVCVHAGADAGLLAAALVLARGGG